MHSIGNNQETTILFGSILDNIIKIKKNRQIFFITDENVYKFYKHIINQRCYISIQPGEGSKNIDILEQIITDMLDAGVDRSWLIIGFGGGVITDITGFIATVYMRGVSFGFVPTTLLGMVDAAFGGKNGINFKQYKNMIGTFSLPEFVLVDRGFLNTLGDAELKNGFAEVIKYGAIFSENFFSYLENHIGDALTLKDEVIDYIIKNCICFKNRIVSSDLKDNGVRNILNFGHTVGHALEKNKYVSTHGHGVAIGMVAAAKLSLQKHMISKKDFLRLVAILQAFSLPTELKGVIENIIEAIKKDKKKNGKQINFVLLDKIGSASVHKILMHHIEEVLHDLYKLG